MCIVDTDCEVDFAPPLDYVEPVYEKPAAKAGGGGDGAAGGGASGSGGAGGGGGGSGSGAAEGGGGGGRKGKEPEAAPVGGNRCKSNPVDPWMDSKAPGFNQLKTND